MGVHSQNSDQDLFERDKLCLGNMKSDRNPRNSLNIKEEITVHDNNMPRKPEKKNPARLSSVFKSFLQNGCLSWHIQKLNSTVFVFFQRDVLQSVEIRHEPWFSLPWTFIYLQAWKWFSNEDKLKKATCIWLKKILPNPSTKLYTWPHYKVENEESEGREI